METTTSEAIGPPAPPGPLTWLKYNLFSNWYNSLFTILSLALIIWAGSVSVRWLFFTANWDPVVGHPLLYLLGQYTRTELWRIGLNVVLASILFGMSWRVWSGVMRVLAITYGAFLLVVAFWPLAGQGLTFEIRGFLLANLALIVAGYLTAHFRHIKPKYLLAAWVVMFLVGIFIVHGIPRSTVLPVVPTGLWGGLLVTMLLAVGGIALSFPVGVLLALGRKSSLPVVSIMSTTFIEVVRGVPLIGILFLSSLIIPLFLPTELRIDRLLRALLGMTLFSAAYTAENVRGGLAAVPAGQTEAAKAVGLNGFQITFLIVLPQALRAVIPPMVGQFISLFKDTTLAAGIAVFEFLSVGRSILQGNPQYFGLQLEVYLFITAVFWILCYLMSYASLKLEAALGVGER
jgi:general L-amino acid transport system permease protein